MKQLTTYFPLLFLLLLGACKNSNPGNTARLTDDALMDTVQRRTFNYFWEGAEPNSGLAPERIHMDGIYPEKDQNVVFRWLWLRYYDHTFRYRPRLRHP